MIVATVLRSGGEYTRDHVYAIRHQVGQHLPGAQFRCLSDVQLPTPWYVPMERQWPGWWAKMEMCRPGAFRGPILYVDLDTVFLRDATPLVRDAGTSIVIRDFYRGRTNPRAVQSSLMLLTEEERALVWEAWAADPGRWMRMYSGDQDVFQELLADRVAFWQDTHPGMVVGYKTDVRGRGGPPDGAAVVVFHGLPRPWNSGEPWAEEAFRIRLKSEVVG